MMPRGAVNGWRCDKCGRHTVAVHVDAGVTPMFLACRASGEPNCGRAVSTGYRTSYVLSTEIGWEWYRPGPTERRLSPDERAHVAQGGLLLRALTDAGRAALEDGVR